MKQRGEERGGTREFVFGRGAESIFTGRGAAEARKLSGYRGEKREDVW